MNLVTKSGTNRSMGVLTTTTAMRHWRRYRLSNKEILPCAIEQWGESAGGPFWKDHTFWFENFEKQKFKIATGYQGTEPSTAYQSAAAPILAYYGVARELGHRQPAYNSLARRFAHWSRI